MDIKQTGQFFSDDLMNEIRAKISCVSEDPFAGRRIYFENAGGALRLKDCCDMLAVESALPDAHKRPSKAAHHLAEMVDQGMKDAMLTFGAKSGVISSQQTVSWCIANVTGAIVLSVPGSNVVTTDLEHPAVSDSAVYYAQVTGKELRSARIDPKTGAVDVEDLLGKIDKDTCLLSFIHASNITGTINDAKAIVREARKIKPDLYVLLDSTQHIPHGAIDVEDLGVDAAGFTPYKMLGKRGMGIAWVSERTSKLPHVRVVSGPETDWDFGSCEPAAWKSWTLVVDYLCRLGGHFSKSADRRELFLSAMNAIELHERALMHRMLNGTDKVPGVRDIPNARIHFVDDLTKRDCILPLTFDNINPSDAVTKYREKGISVFARERTSPMSRRALDGCGLSGLVRVSPMHYNTKEEVDYFLKATAEIAEGK